MWAYFGNRLFKQLLDPKTLYQSDSAKTLSKLMKVVVGDAGDLAK